MRVAIVGTGIGGLAAAVALHKVGVEALVLEQAPSIRKSAQDSHSGKTQCAGGRGCALVPRKSAGNVRSAWTDSISCTYFVPFCAHAKMEHFR